MSQGNVVSVNVGRAAEAPWAGSLGRTAIDKRAVPGPIELGRLGLAGDESANRRHHGGEHQAVYAFAREDLDVWGERLGVALRPGAFGENLTTAGLDVNAALVGERWRVGTALLEVSSVRTPCRVFQAWLTRQGLDAVRWQRRFAEEGRPGPYLRVLEPGMVGAGDRIVVEHRPDHPLSVSAMFRAVTSQRDLLPLLLEVEAVEPGARRKAARLLAGRG